MLSEERRNRAEERAQYEYARQMEVERKAENANSLIAFDLRRNG